MQLRESGNTARTAQVLAIVAAVLQVALAPQISIAAGTVNFMVVLAITLALSSDASSAVFIGFFSGLFYDMTSSAPIGLMALILTVVSFLVSASARGAMGGLTRESIRLAVLGIAIVNVAYGICLFVMGEQTDLLWAVLGHGISSTVLDSLVALVFLMVAAPSSSQRSFTARPRSSRYKVPR